MKKFKLFACILAIIALCGGCIGLCSLSSTPVVQAASIKDTNIVYESVDKQIEISEEKVLNITLTESIRFKESGINVGLTKNISHTNKITRIVNGKKYVTTTKNKFKLNYVTVDGQPEYNFTETDDEYFYIMTGADYDYKSAGVYEYQFNYTLDMGEDFIDDFDDFTFDLMDYDYGSPVGKFSASITLPKSFYDENSNLQQMLTFRTNKMAGLGHEAVDAQIVGNTITCHYDKGLAAGNGITMQLILPNKYFNTSYSPSSFYYVIIAAIVLACLGVVGLFIFSIIYSYSRRGIVVTSEFYPPKGFSPLDVARAYRGKVVSKDFAALVLDWAAKGLVKIDASDKHDVVLIKQAEFPDLSRTDENYLTKKYEREYFNALFKKSNIYSTKESKSSYSKDISGAVTKIFDYDDDTKKPTKVARIIGHALALLPWIVYVLWFGLNVSTFGFVMLFITLFITVGTLVFLYVPMPTLFKLIWCGGFTGIPIAMLCIMGFTAIYDIYNLATITFVLLFVLHAISRFIKIRSHKYDAHRGEVLGFKKFLVKVELRELEMLVHDNPEYYYDVLPYCYIFGITKVMEDKFKALHVDTPTYCPSGISTTVFCHSLAHSFMHSTHISSSGSFSSGGFGGGGSHGSSGGGGGGGGSHGR